MFRDFLTRWPALVAADSMRMPMMRPPSGARVVVQHNLLPCVQLIALECVDGFDVCDGDVVFASNARKRIAGAHAIGTRRVV